MRKFLVSCALILALLFLGDYVYYHTDFYLDFHPDAPITTWTKTEGRQILVDTGDGFAPFEIKGVDMGAGKPGHFATEFQVTKEDYLCWFGMIQEMGANTIRIYTISSPVFHQAFYEYNQHNEKPLYLIHGLWLNDYIQNSRLDAYDKKYIEPFLEDAKRMVDVIHGRRKVSYDKDRGSGTYRYDISPWVLGYILGVKWEDITVAYTDHMEADHNQYMGRYFYTTKEASPFECMLAHLGDKVATYEAGRYKEQRLIAFSNWPTTDPLDYDGRIEAFFRKITKVDVEHIKTTNAFLSGQFASYHVYPYYPSYLRHSEDLTPYTDENGTVNTYLAYLKLLVAHHSMPVVISEFGVPSSRGMAQIDYDRGFNQGFMSEKEQGNALIHCYQDIKKAGCAGSVVFTWQDEWFKRTWNTMHAVDLTQTAYWSDYQTNEQYFGLLSFDPGKEQSICYVDGDDSEWQDQSILLQNGALSLSMKYDEKFVYFLLRGVDFSQPIYVPLDITPKTGSQHCQNFNLDFARAADFLLVLNGPDDSRVLVQERYNVLRAMYLRDTARQDPFAFPPAKDSPVFQPIELVLQVSPEYTESTQEPLALTYETGKLTYGNANPQQADFNSLADFCAGEDFVEVKLPWQLLNFANPSDMEIHDDYYLHYGVESMRIKSLAAGISQGQEEVIPMAELSLKGWGNRVTYHERLKQSYYMMQSLWAKGEVEP